MRVKIGFAFVLSSAVALVLISAASATHQRPGSGTPIRVPLVHAYKQCTTPNTNSTHVAPIALGSCTSATLISDMLTSGTGGAYTGFSKLEVFCTDASQPPCDPTDGVNEEDIKVTAQGTDIRCKAGGRPGCPTAGADYTGRLIGESVIRITDHSNGGTACTDGTGATCVTATVQDTTFAITAPCNDNGGPQGANCGVVTTINTQVPFFGGAVKEFQRAVISVFGLTVLDWGNDGQVGAGCPPVCGTGDEGLAATQGLFLP